MHSSSRDRDLDLDLDLSLPPFFSLFFLLLFLHFYSSLQFIFAKCLNWSVGVRIVTTAAADIENKFFLLINFHKISTLEGEVSWISTFFAASPYFLCPYSFHPDTIKSLVEVNQAIK